MPVYFVQGKLGSGKTLASIYRMKQALNEGRRVATNIDLNLEKLVNPWAKKTFVIRMPDKPSPSDFEALPLGYDGDYKSEDFNGDLHLDECGIWFNSRNWNDKGRAGIIEWIIHARKKRWNLYFYVQDIDVVDKQAREMFAEHVVTCKRTDRLNIPFIGWALNIFSKTALGKKFNLPKFHMAIVQYGTSQFAPIVDRWWYRGEKLYDAYDTEQAFYPPEHPNSVKLSTVLPPWYTYGRYHTRLEHLKNAIRYFKTKGRHFFLLGAGLAVLGTNAAVTALPEVPKKGWFGCNEAYKALYGSCDAYPVVKEQGADKRTSKTSKTSVSQSSGSVAQSLGGLGTVYVTGSVASGRGYDYFFSCDGRPCDLASIGFQIEPVTWCQAIITRDDVRKLIYCNPYIDYGDIPERPQQEMPDVVGNAVDPIVKLFNDANPEPKGG